MSRLFLLVVAITVFAGCGATTSPAPVAVTPVGATPAGIDAKEPLVIVKVKSISCEGCCSTIKEELAALPGVTKVEADPESKLVHVQVADKKFDSKIVLDRLETIQYSGVELVQDVKN